MLTAFGWDSNEIQERNTVTTDQLNALLELQTLDLTLLQFKKEAAGIPARQEALNAGLAGARAAAAEAEMKLGEREKEIRGLEGEVSAVREKINRYRSQQMEVKTNESYKALEHEIASAEEEIGLLEDRELLLMEEVDTLKRRLASCQADLESATQKAGVEKARLDERLQAVREQFEELKGRREALTTRVDPAVLQKYLGHLSSKQDAFLVPVHQQTCGGCHMKLTPQVLHDLHSGQRWAFCSHCGRPLYDPAAR